MIWRRRPKGPLIGFALDIRNPMFGIRYFGSPHEVLESVRSGQMRLRSLVNHADTDVKSVEVFKESPDVEFSGGSHAEAILEILDCLDHSAIGRLSEVAAREREALVANDDCAALPLLAAVAANSDQAIRILVKNGADVERAGGLGMAPIHWAAALGQATIVSVLLDAGADPDRLSWFFVSACELASMNGHRDMLKRCVRHGKENVVPPSPREILIRMATADARDGHGR